MSLTKTVLMSDWVLEQGADGWQIVNRGEDGKRRFFRIVAGPYSPVIEEEPDQAEPLGVGTYVNRSGGHTSPEGLIKGIVCKENPGGDIVYQGNLTNFRGKDEGLFEPGAHLITVKGRRWRLYRLMAENKARIKNYVAFYLPDDAHDDRPVEIVQAFELG